MRLGSITLPTDLILAPLMDVTTPSFRQLIYDLGGVGMVVTPMLFVPQFVAAPKTILPHLERMEKQRPFSLQIVASGRNPDQIRTTLDYLSAYNFDVLDINAGCPAPHTMKSGGGGSFLREYQQTRSMERLRTVIETCVKYAPTPVSLKTRLGFLRETDFMDFLPLINNSGLEFLTLHGRTIKQKYGGEANYAMIRTVQEKLTIPLVANGDVKDYASYHRIKTETQCDAVMIGRAAMFDPAIFSRIQDAKFAVKQGKDPTSPFLFHSLDTIRTYLLRIEQYIGESSEYWNNERFKLAEFRRLAIWLIKGIPGYKKVRTILSKIMDFTQLKNYLFGDQIALDFTQGLEVVLENS